MEIFEAIMSLKTIGIIEIPGATDSAFDHGAFDPKTRRVFVAHTARDSVEVIDHDAGSHIATLPGFPEAAGVVAEDGSVLVTNRGAASLAWLDGQNLKTQAVIDHRRGRLYVACDEGALVEVDISAGAASHKWPIAGVPDATFFNPGNGLVHVAIGEPGLVQTIDLRTGVSIKTMTAMGAHTTAFVAPDMLYVFSPAHGGALVLADGQSDSTSVDPPNQRLAARSA